MINETALNQKLATIEIRINKQSAAINFIITHLLNILDEESDGHKISDKLRTSIIESLNKITQSQSSLIKSGINELLQPPVRPIFGNNPTDFIK